MTSLNAEKNTALRVVQVMRNLVVSGMFGAALLGATPAFGVAYVTNDVYTVTSYSATSDRQQLNMSA